MKQFNIFLIATGFSVVFVMGSALAAEMDHSRMDHSSMDHSKMMKQTAPKPKKGKLAMVQEQPASGRAREAGSDGRYHMEPTTVQNSLATQCTQASRGLIILDNKTWTSCGGKTKGVAVGPKPAKGGGHSGH